MKTTMAGPHGSAGPGQEITVDDENGKALITGGYAVPAKPAPESAMMSPPETEAMPKAKPRRGTK